MSGPSTTKTPGAKQAAKSSKSSKTRSGGRKDRPQAHVWVSAASDEDLQAFQTKIDYRFADTSLLVEALTHASAEQTSRRGSEPILDNERLEFLGDRVLGLMAAEALVHKFPRAREGQLAPRLNALVRRETCAEIAKDCGLAPLITLARSEAQSGGRKKPAILADACEALIAALYLDGGMPAAQAFFDRYWGRLLTDHLDTVPRDAKTRLQEWAQATLRTTPVYEVVSREGPDHAPDFEVEVQLEGLAPGRGKGGSKRLAEQDAAQTVLEREGVVAAKPPSDSETDTPPW